MVNFISSVLQTYVWPPLVVMVSLLISVPVLIFKLVADQLPGLHPLEILLSLTSAQQLVRVGGEPGSLKVAPLALLKIRSAIIFSFLLILPEILPAVMETIPVRIDLLYDIHIVWKIVIYPEINLFLWEAIASDVGAVFISSCHIIAILSLLEVGSAIRGIYCNVHDLPDIRWTLMYCFNFVAHSTYLRRAAPVFDILRKTRQRRCLSILTFFWSGWESFWFHEMNR